MSSSSLVNSPIVRFIFVTAVWVVDIGPTYEEMLVRGLLQ